MVSFLWVYGWTILHGSLAALAGPAMVSSTWRKPAMTMSSAAQVALVDAALQKSTSVLATNGEFAATLYSEMAEFDVVSNQTKYQVELKDYLSGSTKSQQKSQEPECANLLESLTDPTYILLGNWLSMAHASIRAYAAYKDPVFLQLANESWAFAQTYTLFGSAAASGSLGFKNFTMNSACQAKSMVGGTFDTTNATDTSITAFASASFFAVSALLAEATSDPVYLKAAFDSADFIWGHLSAQNLVQTAISADACALDDEPNSFNTGLMIEGLAVLYSVTQNATTQAMLNAVINATITNGDWQTEDGIIVHGGSKLGDKYLVRGLAAAYARDVTARELRAPVHDYIAVQFNAVVDLASSNGNAIYGGAWTGPPSTVFSQSNQTTAISALLSGMALHDADTTSLLPPGPFPSSPPLLVADPHRGRMAMMVGGTIGGVVLVGILAGLWLFLRRRARRRIPLLPVSSTKVGSATAVSASSFTSTYSPSLPSRGTTVSASSFTSPSTKASPHSPILPSPATAAKLKARDSIAKLPIDTTPPLTLVNRDDSAHSPVDSEPPAPTLVPNNSLSVSSPAQELPTTELVRLLNERLRDHRWDEAEVPPEYGTNE